MQTFDSWDIAALVFFLLAAGVLILAVMIAGMYQTRPRNKRKKGYLPPPSPDCCRGYTLDQFHKDVSNMTAEDRAYYWNNRK